MQPFLLWCTAVLLALLPALLWLYFWYQKSTTTLSVKKLVFRSFFFGAVGIIPLLGVKIMLQSSPDLVFVWEFIQERSFFFSLLLLTIILAGLEEFLKHFSLFGLNQKGKATPEKITNGIIYFISAGIGFAFMENALYFRDTLIILGMHPVFWRIFLFRSFATMLGHALFSAVFGIFWLHAAFSKSVQPKNPKSLLRHWHVFFDRMESNRFLKGFVKKNTSPRKQKKVYLMLEAFFFATLLHAIFNLLVSSGNFGVNLLYFIPPFLLFLFLLISHELSSNRE